MRREVLRLMLVEEDPTLADITAFRLELLGYEVTSLYNAERLLEKIEEELPDLFIIDMALPGISGFELISRLQNGTETSEIPVIAFSTDANPNSVQMAYQAGARDYLVTPYDPAVLESKLTRLLETAVTVD